MPESMIESPLARLSEEEIEALGKEFDALHDEVFDSLGERDAKYIRSMIQMHRRLLVASEFALAVVLLGGAHYSDNVVRGVDVFRDQFCVSAFVKKFLLPESYRKSVKIRFVFFCESVDRVRARNDLKQIDPALSAQRNRVVLADERLSAEPHALVRHEHGGRLVHQVPVLDALRAERDVARLAVSELLAFQDARADLDAALGRWP